MSVDARELSYPADGGTYSNILFVNAELDRKIFAEMDKLRRPPAPATTTSAEIERLEGLRTPLIIAIGKYQIEDPLDQQFIDDFAGYLDTVDDSRASGREVSVDDESAAMETLRMELIQRNSDNANNPLQRT